MRVLLANPRGFCAGVNMAIECLEEVLRRFDEQVYVYHEIVHNRYVVQQFERRGVTFVENVADVPEGALLVLSAHGVSPEVRREARRRRLRTIDATCPLVTKVHLEALRFAQQGYHIILIGHEGHDEVIGTMGEAPESITLVESADDVDRLAFPDDARLAYLTQTTLSVEEANAIIERLQKRFPHVEGPPKEDICYATTNRQQAVAALAGEADLVLVLGSQNSSNSRRLMELARSAGAPAYLVDGVNDVDPAWLEGVETVVITAGASAPEVVVRECVDFLVQNYAAEVQEVTIREEHVSFPLPRELRTAEIP